MYKLLLTDHTIRNKVLLLNDMNKTKDLSGYCPTWGLQQKENRVQQKRNVKYASKAEFSKIYKYQNLGTQICGEDKVWYSWKQFSLECSSDGKTIYMVTDFKVILLMNTISTDKVQYHHQSHPTRWKFFQKHWIYITIMKQAIGHDNIQKHIINRHASYPHLWKINLSSFYSVEH